MKILFTGGGTGGHFYPLIAVAEKINDIADKEKLLDIKLYYMSNSPYDKTALFENGIKYIYVPAGKLRIYPSIQNFIDIFKTITGIFTALIKVFSIYPDVIFSKGGYASFPCLFAGRILRIPIIIHESDSFPGRVSTWSGKFAKKIAISFPEAIEYFNKEKTAWTGQPIRKILLEGNTEGSFEYFNLDPNIPVIFIIGGSQGAVLINDAIIDALPELTHSYQIIHQVGTKNINDVNTRAKVSLDNHIDKIKRYHPIGFLNPLQMKMAGGIASIVISRAGSTLFEIANWGVPSIIIPFTKSNGDHAKKNAYNYARAGGCIVLEENNISKTVLENTISDILNNPQKRKDMSISAKSFSHPDASEKIAKEIISIGLGHEK